MTGPTGPTNPTDPARTASDADPAVLSHDPESDPELRLLLEEAVDQADQAIGPFFDVEAGLDRLRSRIPEQLTPPHPQDRSSTAQAMFGELRRLPDGAPKKAELRNQLVRMHLPLVDHLARRFRNRGEPLDDLTEIATMGLIKSVDRFDPERGIEFSTYAVPTVVGEIKRHLRDKSWAVRVPRRLQERRLTLTRATVELSQQHGRPPTVHELAEQLGISEAEVLEGLDAANAYPALRLEPPDTDDASSAADTLGAEDEVSESAEFRESLKPLLAELNQKLLVEE